MENNKIEQWISRDTHIKQDMINRMVDLFDEATMKHYYGFIDEERENTDVTNYNNEKATTNYYESLFKVIDYFLNGEDLKVDDEVKNEIDDILEAFEADVDENGINTEEVRRAFLLLDIKAFKNVNFPLDLITPDVVGLIFAKLINACYFDKKELLVLDPNFGVGNLMFTLYNYAKMEIHMIGMENHPLLASAAMHKANMMMIPLEMYYQDALEYQVLEPDLVLSDLATYDYDNSEYHSKLYDQGVKYFPYLAIEHDLMIDKPHLSFYLVNNDFFSHDKSNLFNDYLHERGHIVCLITLPTSMFQNQNEAKSILVIQNVVTTSKDMHIFMLPDFSNKEKFLNKLEEVEDFLKEIKK